MAELPPDLLKAASSIPVDVLVQLDKAEVVDRLIEVERLQAKAGATSSPVLRAGYLDQARAILKATPRAEVEKQINSLLAKADAAATPQWAEECRAQAERLRREHHPAPHHAPTAPVPADGVTARELTELVKAEVARARTPVRVLYK